MWHSYIDDEAHLMWHSYIDDEAHLMSHSYIDDEAHLMSHSYIDDDYMYLRPHRCYDGSSTHLKCDRSCKGEETRTIYFYFYFFAGQFWKAASHFPVLREDCTPQISGSPIKTATHFLVHSFVPVVCSRSSCETKDDKIGINWCSPLRKQH